MSVPVPVVAAAVTAEEQDDLVAAVCAEGVNRSLEINQPFININGINGERCKLIALMNTGSPVSFVKFHVFERYIKSVNVALNPIRKTFRNLSKQTLDILGKVESILAIESKEKVVFEIELCMLKNDLPESDLILGHDFLVRHGLTLVYSPATSANRERRSVYGFTPLRGRDAW